MPQKEQGVSTCEGSSQIESNMKTWGWERVCVHVECGYFALFLTMFLKEMERLKAGLEQYSLTTWALKLTWTKMPGKKKIPNNIQEKEISEMIHASLKDKIIQKGF